MLVTSGIVLLCSTRNISAATADSFLGWLGIPIRWEVRRLPGALDCSPASVFFPALVQLKDELPGSNGIQELMRFLVKTTNCKPIISLVNHLKRSQLEGLE